jgi:alpha-L-arabinofuranosidase
MTCLMRLVGFQLSRTLACFLSLSQAVAAWLNVFVRKADVVKIACIAQSVNVISPVRLTIAGVAF